MIYSKGKENANEIQASGDSKQEGKMESKPSNGLPATKEVVPPETEVFSLNPDLPRKERITPGKEDSPLQKFSLLISLAEGSITLLLAHLIFVKTTTTTSKSDLGWGRGRVHR